jgi:hypothetical protein
MAKVVHSVVIKFESMAEKTLENVKQLSEAWQAQLSEETRSHIAQNFHFDLDRQEPELPRLWPLLKGGEDYSAISIPRLCCVCWTDNVL